MEKKKYYEAYKMPTLCSKSENSYINSAKVKTPLERALNAGITKEEFYKKISVGVKLSIETNPDERIRRAKNRINTNKSSFMRNLASKTAKETSSRPEILQKRTDILQQWRDNNPEIFYEKCISKMLSGWQSKPEKILYEICKSFSGFSFKRNQTVKSNSFINKSKRKQVDIVDKEKRIYIEYDGPLHFKETSLKISLAEIQLKDKLLNEHILENNWTLIRISYDQFSYKAQGHFIDSCLDSLKKILSSSVPGLYFIGNMYVKS